MKITKEHLKKIIKEEIEEAAKFPVGDPYEKKALTEQTFYIILTNEVVDNYSQYKISTTKRIYRTLNEAEKGLQQILQKYPENELDYSIYKCKFVENGVDLRHKLEAV